MSVGAGKAAAPPAGGLTPGRRNLCAQSSWRAHTLDWWGGLIDLPNVESFAAPPTRPSRFPHSTGSLSRHRRTATPLPVTRRPIGTFIRDRRRTSRRRLGYGRLAGRVAFRRGLHRAAVHGLLGRSTRLAGQSLHHRQHHYRLQSHSRCAATLSRRGPRVRLHVRPAGRPR